MRLADLNTGLWNDRVLKDGDLREFTVVTLSSRSAAPISYVEQPDRLYLQSSEAATLAVKPRSGRGTLSVAATVSLDQALALPAELLDPGATRRRRAAAGCSTGDRALRGWKQRLVPSIARIEPGRSKPA